MSLTLPGDRLASAMEYVPGPGVYERNGELFAALTGEHAWIIASVSWYVTSRTLSCG